VEPIFVERPHYLPGGERAQRAEAHDVGFGLMAGVILADKKYVREPDPSGRTIERLYDLTQDPAELHDACAEDPEDRARLSKLLDGWLAAHPAPAPSDQQPMTPERQRVLEALGYAGKTAPPPKKAADQPPGGEAPH
jgi:hypothetical protein